MQNIVLYTSLHQQVANNSRFIEILTSKLMEVGGEGRGAVATGRSLFLTQTIERGKPLRRFPYITMGCLSRLVKYRHLKTHSLKRQTYEYETQNKIRTFTESLTQGTSMQQPGVHEVTMVIHQSLLMTVHGQNMWANVTLVQVFEDPTP